MAFQPEHLAVLRRGRNLQAHRFAGKRLDFSFTAQHGGGERDRNVRVEVAAPALEFRMRGEPDAQIQIARLRTARTVLALAADAHAGTLADASRNAHVDGAGLTIVRHGETPHRAVVRIFESQLELVFDVASLARGPRAPARAPAGIVSRAAGGTAEERVEEIGERIAVTEHLAHFLFGHRAEAAALTSAADVDVPR